MGPTPLLPGLATTVAAAARCDDGLQEKDTRDSNQEAGGCPLHACTVIAGVARLGAGCSEPWLLAGAA